MNSKLYASHHERGRERSKQRERGEREREREEKKRKIAGKRQEGKYERREKCNAARVASSTESKRHDACFTRLDQNETVKPLLQRWLAGWLAVFECRVKEAARSSVEGKERKKQ